MLVHNFGYLSKEGAGSRTWLERHCGGWGNHEVTGLCLPPGIHDRALLLADDAVIPLPRFGVDRLTDGAKQPQGRQVVLVGPRLTETHQSARRPNRADAGC